MRILFELSGEHPLLPCAEIESVGSVIECAPQVAIAECPQVSETVRLALTHTVMEYLGQCVASENDILTFISSQSLIARKPFRVRVKKIQGTAPHLSPLRLERLIGTYISGQVALSHPEEEYRMLIAGSCAYLGRVLVRIDRGAYLYRNPLRRSFFHPGVMLPRFARAMVNLSLIRRGELLIDPFCGTGGMLLEAQLVGAEICGGDADSLMASGARKNIPHADVILGNATRMPFCDCAADAIVTDLPYGQSVGIHAPDPYSLYAGTLQEVHRILRPGRRAVLISHRDLRHLVAPLALLQYYEQRIHKSLTRRIMVLKKIKGT